MDRKQILKDMKKQKKEYEKDEEQNYLSRFIMTIFILIVLLIALYLIVGIFITKTIDFSKKSDDTKEEVTIDNSTILMGEIFNQKEESYYVLIYDKKDTDNSISQFLSLYKSKENALTVYEVDSSLSFNSKYIVEKDSNKSPTSYEDLKVITPTLIKIENKVVTEYNEGLDSIKEIFK